ncbi:DinB family protein [Paenibacillus rigui]|uniref:Damage-inducible protein DinB n=1 Tax=Paenibacillus rigui TaxID=554312 RepID=A0A229UH05_9BACL|nr:DinB family protein [Paenibacillus rigui]OXM82641.1 hypothetical protein CF651_29925 [Paenibacillus rigui]
MFHTIESFIEEYSNEAAATQKLLDALTDASLQQEVAPGYRTLGHLAYHLIPSEGLLSPLDLQLEVPAEQSQPPAAASEIAEAYRKVTQSLLEAVRTQWTDEKLEESALVFGATWKNGLTLYALMKHEIHHRGQLTILMRQAGLPVYGIYGPTKEEWQSMGLPVPAI